MMTEPFLITGLPRSRTAWMAVAATNDQSICLHEPMRHYPRWDDVFDKVWNGFSSRYVGISDHGLGFHLPEIMKRLAPRTLIIERPVAEVKASLSRIGLAAPLFCDLLHRALAYEHPNIMRVPYDLLEKSGVVMCALQHLMPEARLRHSRIAELQTMVIQADIAASKRAAASRIQDAAAFLPGDVLARLRAG